MKLNRVASPLRGELEVYLEDDTIMLEGFDEPPHDHAPGVAHVLADEDLYAVADGDVGALSYKRH